MTDKRQMVAIVAAVAVLVFGVTAWLAFNLRLARLELNTAQAEIASQKRLIDEMEQQRDIAYAQMAEWATQDTPTTPDTPEATELTEATESAVVYAAPKQDAPAGLRSLGTFKITHYCCCEICCGNTLGITASGRAAVPNYSIAVDKSVIPLGSTVWLDYGDGNLVEYRADDTGGAVKGAVIDVCVADHATALQLGRRSATVYVQEVLK